MTCDFPERFGSLISLLSSETPRLLWVALKPTPLFLMQGARFAPRLLLTRPSYPRKVAWQCQLTLALHLRGLLVIFVRLPASRFTYAWFFQNPLPVETRTPGCGCGLTQVRVLVALENPTTQSIRIIGSKNRSLNDGGPLAWIPSCQYAFEPNL